VRHTFRDLLSEANQYIITNTYATLKKYSKVVSDNKRFSRGIDLNIYNSYKDLLEKIQASRFKNFNDAIVPLFSDKSTTTKELFRDYLV
jgi:hypothetical protein